MWEKTWVFPCIFDGNTIDYHYKFRVVDQLVGGVRSRCVRQVKSAFFEPFVEQHKTSAFPAQQFYAVALFVDEQENITAHWVFVQFVAHDTI